MTKPAFTPSRFAYDPVSPKVVAPTEIRELGFLAGVVSHPGYLDQQLYEAGEWLTYLDTILPSTDTLTIGRIIGAGDPLDPSRSLTIVGADDLWMGTTAGNVAVNAADIVTITGGVRAQMTALAEGSTVQLSVATGAAASSLVLDRDTGNVTLTGGAAVNVTAAGTLTLDSNQTVIGSTVATIIDSDTLASISAPAIQLESGVGGSVDILGQGASATVDVTVAGAAAEVTVGASGAGSAAILEATGGPVDARVLAREIDGFVVVSGAGLAITAANLSFNGSGDAAIAPAGNASIAPVGTLTLAGGTTLSLQAVAGVMTTSAADGQIGADATSSSSNGVFPMEHRLVVASGGSANHTSIDFAGEITDWHIVQTDSNTGTVTLSTTSGIVNTLTIPAPNSSAIERGTALVLANRGFAVGGTITVASSAGGPACVAYVRTLRTS